MVDAFEIHDDVLNSVLGRFDGDVYTHLYKSAVNAPNNKSEVRQREKCGSALLINFFLHMSLNQIQNIYHSYLTIS